MTYNDSAFIQGNKYVYIDIANEQCANWIVRKYIINDLYWNQQPSDL